MLHRIWKFAAVGARICGRMWKGRVWEDEERVNKKHEIIWIFLGHVQCELLTHQNMSNWRCQSRQVYFNWNRQDTTFCTWCKCHIFSHLNFYDCNGGYMENLGAKYRLMSLLCVFLYNEYPRYVNNTWATLKCHRWHSTDHSAQGGGAMSYWPTCTGWRHHVLLTSLLSMEASCLTGQSAQGGGIVSYRPLYTGWRHHVLLTTLHKAEVSCLTDHSAQGGGIMSYWPLCTGWRYHVLLTTMHRVEVSYLTDHSAQGGGIMSYWPLCTGWRHHILLTTLHRVEAPCLTEDSVQGGGTMSYWPPCTRCTTSYWPPIQFLAKFMPNKNAFQ